MGQYEVPLGGISKAEDVDNGSSAWTAVVAIVFERQHEFLLRVIVTA
jgi:hypothetical protein